MTEITSEQHRPATVYFDTYCSVCACTHMCDTGWCCVTVAYRVPEPRGNVSSLQMFEKLFEFGCSSRLPGSFTRLVQCTELRRHRLCATWSGG